MQCSRKALHVCRMRCKTTTQKTQFLCTTCGEMFANETIYYHNVSIATTINRIHKRFWMETNKYTRTHNMVWEMYAIAFFFWITCVTPKLKTVEYLMEIYGELLQNFWQFLILFVLVCIGYYFSPLKHMYTDLTEPWRSSSHNMLIFIFISTVTNTRVVEWSSFWKFYNVCHSLASLEYMNVHTIGASAYYSCNIFYLTKKNLLNHSGLPIWVEYFYSKNMCKFLLCIPQI